MNYSRGMVHMFIFIILLATLTTLLPYALNSLAEVRIIIKDRKSTEKLRLRNALMVSIPAFFIFPLGHSRLRNGNRFLGVHVAYCGITILYLVKIEKYHFPQAKLMLIIGQLILNEE